MIDDDGGDDDGDDEKELKSRADNLMSAASGSSLSISSMAQRNALLKAISTNPENKPLSDRRLKSLAQLSKRYLQRMPKTRLCSKDQRVISHFIQLKTSNATTPKPRTSKAKASSQEHFANSELLIMSGGCDADEEGDATEY